MVQVFCSHLSVQVLIFGLYLLYYVLGIAFPTMCEVFFCPVLFSPCLRWGSIPNLPGLSFVGQASYYKTKNFWKNKIRITNFQKKKDPKYLFALIYIGTWSLASSFPFSLYFQFLWAPNPWFNKDFYSCRQVRHPQLVHLFLLI